MGKICTEGKFCIKGYFCTRVKIKQTKKMKKKVTDRGLGITTIVKNKYRKVTNQE